MRDDDGNHLSRGHFLNGLLKIQMFPQAVISDPTGWGWWKRICVQTGLAARHLRRGQQSRVNCFNIAACPRVSFHF